MGGGFTLLFEAMTMLLAGQMPVREVVRITGEEDTRLWRLIRRLVEAAHASKDWSRVKAIAIDETSTRRGRSYATVVLDLETRAVLFMVEGRNSQTLERFAEALRAHGGDPAQIEWPANGPTCLRRNSSIAGKRGKRKKGGESGGHPRGNRDLQFRILRHSTAPIVSGASSVFTIESFWIPE